MTTAGAVVVDVRLEPDDLRRQLADDVRAGLASRPRELPPKWFYDETGCRLFDDITRLPEYYLTRTERGILESAAPSVAELTRADVLVELGSGTSEKTRLLLDAMTAAGRLRRFVPFDVSEPTLRAAASAVAAEYPGLEVHAVVGDLDHHVGALPAGGRRAVAFLGSTLGNLRPAQRGRFMEGLRGSLRPGESLLLGVDLVKERSRLEAAYDDREGVTAEFNRNVLRVLNRRLGADFVPELWDHVARFDAGDEWVEMCLRSPLPQTVRVVALGLEVAFEAGEEMRT
ncbi:MAG TPA: L-histidine N(alpha)-methyltransferase, partial [Acidimicrobiales bacterium]|nr:L-histidine N(alpha)-methyltransferase [Acidimicrobiales bacterium]